MSQRQLNNEDCNNRRSWKFGIAQRRRTLWPEFIFVNNMHSIFTMKYYIFTVQQYNSVFVFSINLAPTYNDQRRWQNHLQNIKILSTGSNYIRRSVKFVITNSPIVRWMNQSWVIVANWLQQTKKTANGSSFNSRLIN